MTPVLVGLGLGALLFVGVARAFSHLLGGMDAADGTSVVAALDVLLATGGLASYAAARRTAGRNPGEALPVD